MARDEPAWQRRASPQLNLLWRGWFKPGTVEPLRRIYDHELVLVEQGHCAVTIDGVAHDCPAGTFLIIPPGVDHLTVAARAAPGVLRACVHFDWEWVADQPPRPSWTFAPARAAPHLLRRAPSWAPPLPAVGRAAGLPEVQRLMATLFQRWDDPHLRPTARAVFLDLLLRLLAAPAAGGPAAGREALALAVREALDRHLDRPVAVQRLLAGLGCTYEHANRSFAAVFGMPPVRWLTLARIDRARAMLGAGRPLAEVAGACGFGSVGYLSRVFRRHTGIAPGMYRRSAMAGDAAQRLSVMPT